MTSEEVRLLRALEGVALRMYGTTIKPDGSRIHLWRCCSAELKGLGKHRETCPLAILDEYADRELEEFKREQQGEE